MTLILTCLTEDCVYQVSDRRLTSFDPPRAPIDDESNKAVFVDGRVIFGYTGISKVNGENTDLWLTRTVASAGSNDMGVVARHIRDQATSAFRAMRFASRYKRHAFQAAGWFTDPANTGLRPGVVTIHNALDSDSFEWLPFARSEFDITTQFPKLAWSQFVLTAVGLRPPPSERGAVYQLLRKCAHRRVRRQEVMLQAMVKAMRWLFHRYEPNSPIGPNLMAVSLPKASVEKYVRAGWVIALAGGPNSSMATFLDVNISGRAHVFGPHAVCGDSVITGFRAWPSGTQSNNHGEA